MKKMCTVYERRGMLYLQASSQTEEGVWVLDGGVSELPSNAPDETLGEAVRSALLQSKGVPHPTRWDRLMEPLLASAGVKSWKTFVNGTRCVSVESEKRGWKLIHFRNLGAKHGFEPVPSAEIDLPPGTNLADKGRSVRDALHASA